MNLTLHLTPETEGKLRQWSALSGKNPETVAIEALQEKLSDETIPLPRATSLAEFQKWFASHVCSTAQLVDDSRESIYEGRGE